MLSQMSELDNMSLLKGLPFWISGRYSFKGGGLLHPRCLSLTKQWVWAQNRVDYMEMTMARSTYVDEPNLKLDVALLLYI
jgi:hypothetical protein